MDKSKSRTDLLAAGRKRLQQFRQKKDGKGSGSSSQGKSSKKNVKVEKHDAKDDSVSSDDRSAESSQQAGDEMGQKHIDSSAGHVDSSIYLSADDPTPEFDDNKADGPSVLPEQETDARRHDVAFQPDLPVTGADPGSHTVLTMTEALVSEEDTDKNSLHPVLDHPNAYLIGTSGGQMVDVSLSRGTSMTLPSEVESLPPNSLISLSSPVQIIPVKDASHSLDVGVRNNYPIHEMFIQVEGQVANEGSVHEFEQETDLSLEPSGVLDVDGSVPNEGMHTTEHEVGANNLGRLNSSKISTSEQEALHPNSMLPDSVEEATMTADIHNFPDLSLIHAREDQVTDLGTMQKADFPGPEKLACSSEIEVDEDRKHNKVLPFAVSIPVLDASNKVVTVAAPEVCTERRRNVITMDGEDTQTLSHISDVERSVGVSHGKVISNIGDLGFSCHENGSPGLVKLANYLKELNEDEFKILMKMRKSDVPAISGDTDTCCEANHGTADVLDAYKEHIYVANVLKDLFKVQLEEQCKPQFNIDNMLQQREDEVSMLAVSLEECKDRNRSLDEDLVLCQSELRTTLNNVEELSTAVHGWKDQYFRSEGDLSILSKDLFECRSLIENLQTEKENLNGNLKSMLYKMNQHVEEKDNMLKEKENLLLEIGELKSQLADLHLQNATLIDNMNSAAAKMRKLDDERQSLVQDTMILSSELADCKFLLADAQAKHAIASESIIVLTEEKNRLQSQLHNASLDFEKLTVEMTGSRNRLANLEVENQKLCVNLSLEAEEKKKLKVKNQYLLNNYEVLSSENCAIQEELLSERVEKLNLEANKHKVNLWLEQLIEESIFLRIWLEMLKSIDGESDNADENQHSVNKRDERSCLVDPSFNGTEGRHIDGALNNCTDVQYSALQEHALYFERENIELQVQNEALKDNLHYILAKYSETATMSELLQKLQLTLKSENSLNAKKLKDCLSRVTDMHSQSFEIKHYLGETATCILSQIRNMEIEITEPLLWFDNHWNSVVTQIIGYLGRLDLLCSGSLTFADSPLTRASMDIANRVGTSVDSAISFIKRLQDDFQALELEYQSVNSFYNEVHGNYTNLCKENTASVELLQKVHCGLRSLVTASRMDETGSLVDIEPKWLLNPPPISDYRMLIEELRKDLHEKVQLKLENAKLRTELDNRIKEMDETQTKDLEIHVIAELVELAENQLNSTKLETDSNVPLTSRLGNCIFSLLQAHKEASGKDNLIKEECESAEERGSQIEEELQRLTLLNMQQENEIKNLRRSLREAEEQLSGIQTELQRRAAEVEQSEQRVSSIREKLSIAVAKGKGLIVQRDNLKQSLAETLSEREKFKQQLQLSDNRLLEAETKLKTYAEAGERVEALESELSYIRNSATALRESFLLKDSVLQRIEEILEDLELPEHHHSREIIDKVDWLARSVVGNSNALSATASDQKSRPEGVSYSDNGFVVMDAWKGDTKHNTSLSDDLRIKHEELQNKFYGLAEQNEMLEQSLMERNSIVQRLEEVLDKINMPAHLRSLEAASQIEWLGGALTDALQHSSAIQESLDHHKTHCEKLLAELKESNKNFSDTKSVLESTVKDSDHLLSTLADLTRNFDDAKERATTLELEKNKMQPEIADLQAQLLKNNEYNDDIESGARRMLDLICTALHDESLIETAFVGCSILQLEEILRRLIDDHTRLSAAFNNSQEVDDSSVENAVSTHGGSVEVSSSDHDPSNSKTLKTALEEALGDLTRVKEERDSYMEKHKSLSHEIEAVCKRDEELQHLLNQEEQKSASLREKLNVAVRKGKSLVQQRDSLKQTIEEMKIKVDSLTSEIRNSQHTVTQYEDKCRVLYSYAEKVQASESEMQMLRSRLAETEHYLQEARRTLSFMMDILSGIQLNSGFNIGDPVDKLQHLRKAYHDLLEAKASSDQESVKSKRAAELLLAELNEIQERNDALQDELAKVVDELSELSKGNQIVEAARAEAVSQLSRYSSAQKDEQKKQNIQLVELRSSVDQFLKFSEDVIHLLAEVFSMDLDFFKSLELCLEASDRLHVYGGRIRAEHDDEQKKFFDNGIPAWEKFIACDSLLMYKTYEQFNGSGMDDICGYIEHQVRNCTSNISYLKEKLHSYIVLKAQEATRVSTNLKSVLDEVASRIKSLEKKKENEKNVLVKHIALLYEACADSIREIGDRKALMSTNNPSSMDMRMNVESVETGEDFFLSEELIRTLSERLTAAVKDLSNAEQELFKADHSEMKNTIANLQKEIQEKDVQKERICMELVGQIKRAEAAATNYSHDLEVAACQVHDLETRLSANEKDKKLLEQKMKEMDDEKPTTVELLEKVRSMADLLSAKDQEIESLIQALDEEESELEEMNMRVEQMEMELQRKTKEMEKLEHSHNKAMKKLSVTVSKFDELHDLSASLLNEVEKLQMQIQERDKEISFLRQEVTKCANDILLASESKKNSDEIIELFEWLKTMTSQVDLMDKSPEDLKLNDAQVYKECIQNQIAAVISELEDLRHVAGNRNEMLQVEKNRVQKLMKKQESLETALRQKEAQLNLLEEGPTSSGIGSTETLEKKWVAPGPSTSSQVRSLRKLNNDQVAIAIDDDPASSSRLEDEDEDKVHGFKSLTTSTIVPRVTRPVSDMIDGLWVSCDRTLMRQPALRLTIILYWALLHALLAAYVV